jgi:hypothetical protein
MNTTPFETNVEPRWETYLRAIVFLLPPVIFYWMALVFIMPKFMELWRVANIDISKAVQFWFYTPFFLAKHGFLIFVAVVLLLALLEFLSKGRWARYRRGTVGTMVWVSNVYVLLTLVWFFFLAIVTASALAHPK